MCKISFNGKTKSTKYPEFDKVKCNAFVYGETADGKLCGLYDKCDLENIPIPGWNTYTLKDGEIGVVDSPMENKKNKDQTIEDEQTIEFTKVGKILKKVQKLQKKALKNLEKH